MSDVVGAPELRAEVLRVLHKLTLGHPTLTADDLNDAPLSPAELGLASAATDEELALLNAILVTEAEHRAAEFATLERLLVYCQFDDGPIDDRLVALPDHAFARAALAVGELGWIP